MCTLSPSSFYLKPLPHHSHPVSTDSYSALGELGYGAVTAGSELPKAMLLHCGRSLLWRGGPSQNPSRGVDSTCTGVRQPPHWTPRAASQSQEHAQQHLHHSAKVHKYLWGVGGGRPGELEHLEKSLQGQSLKTTEQEGDWALYSSVRKQASPLLMVPLGSGPSCWCQKQQMWQEVVGSPARVLQRRPLGTWRSAE